MDKKVAKPKKVKHSETLEQLIRMNKDFAVRPAGYNNDRWSSGRISKSKQMSEKEKQRELIHEVDSTIKGVSFPAKEMAMIIRTWMNQEE